MVKDILFVTGNSGKLREVQAFLSKVTDIQLVAQSIDLTEVQDSCPLTISRKKAEEAFRIINGLGPPQRRAAGLDDHDTGGSHCRTRTHANSAVFTRVLVEDTSLCFDAMGGLPGPYIKWFLQRLGVDGLIKMLNGFAEEEGERKDKEESLYYRAATAVCVFSYCEGFAPGSTTELVTKQFVGECHGHIVQSPRGMHNFGWDSIFAPNRDSSVPLGVREVMKEEREGGKWTRSPTPPFSNGLGPKTFAEMTLEEKSDISHRSRSLNKLKAYFESMREE